MKNKKILILSIIVILLAISSVIVFSLKGKQGNDFVEKTLSPTFTCEPTEEPKTVLDELIEQEPEEESFKYFCQDIDYREYMRNEDKYTGQKVKTTLTVNKVDNVEQGTFYICLNYNEEAEKEELYLVQDLRTDDNSNVFEGDTITIYGYYCGVSDSEYSSYEYNYCMIGARYIEFND